MKKCRKGHEYRGDENYRARKGWCPVCHREAQRAYSQSAKGKARYQRYDDSEKGRGRYVAYNHSNAGDDRYARYDQSPKGWMNSLRKRRTQALERRKQRKEAEDS